MNCNNAGDEIPDPVGTFLAFIIVATILAYAIWN